MKVAKYIYTLEHLVVKQKTFQWTAKIKQDHDSERHYTASVQTSVSIEKAICPTND